MENKIPVTVKFKDAFSHATDSRNADLVYKDYLKAVAGIGSSFSEFDRKAQIRFDWVVTDVVVRWNDVVHFQPYKDNKNARCLTGDGNRIQTDDLTKVTCPHCLEGKNPEYWDNYSASLV